MAKQALAKFEFDLLAFVAGRDGATVREVYEDFGKPLGYIRGTIGKAIDRLLKKGLVKRDLVDGRYVYKAVVSQEDLDRQLVSSFVVDRLRGRLSPIAAFLSADDRLTHDELEQLRSILGKLEP